MGFTISLLYLHSYLTCDAIKWITVVWIMIPLFIIGIVIYIIGILLLFILLSTVCYLVSIKRGTYYNALFFLPSTITYNLMLLLDSVDSLESEEWVDTKSKCSIVELIDIISWGILKLKDIYPLNEPEQKCFENKLKKASYVFRSLVLHVTLPQTDSRKELKTKVLQFLNVFLSGNYRDLPDYDIDCLKQDEIDEKKDSPKRFLWLLGLGILLLLPIIGWIILNRFANDIDIPNPLLIIFYTIWYAIVILSFSNNLPPEAKEFIKKDVFERIWSQLPGLKKSNDKTKDSQDKAKDSQDKTTTSNSS